MNFSYELLRHRIGHATTRIQFHTIVARIMTILASELLSFCGISLFLIKYPQRDISYYISQLTFLTPFFEQGYGQTREKSLLELRSGLCSKTNKLTLKGTDYDN